MIKLIIFDADGVLIHPERFSSVLEKQYGISIEATRSFFTGPFQECRIGKMDLKEALTPYLSKWKWDKGVDAFLDIWFNVEYNLNVDLVKYIQELRNQGIACVIGSNQERRRFEHFVEKLGFKDSFDGTYVSAHLGHTKPDQEFFSKVLNDFPNTKKNEVLLIDDREENVKAAEEFGIHALFYVSLEDFKNKLAFLNKT